MVKINRMDTINNDPIWIYEAMKNLARFQSEAGFDKTMEKLETADRQQCTEAIAKGKAAIARLQAELVNIDPITDRKSIVQRNNDIRDCETCIGNLNTRLEGLKHSLINDEEYSTGVTTMYEDLDAITAKAKTTIDKALKTLSPLHEEYSDSVSMAADTMTARESVHGETHMYIDRKKPKAECYSNVRALHKAATTLQAVAD